MAVRFQALWVGLLVVAIVGGVPWIVDASVRGQSPYVGVATVDGAIDSATARYLERVIEDAHETDAALVVVQLDTPGGSADSTRAIVGVILGSRVPIVVYVAPAGAQAASAGTFIAAAAHIAAMAPGTNIGAAAPVTLDGGDVPATMSRKINEDTAAFIRSIAEARGRDVKALEATVTKAVSYSAVEAMQVGIADLMARDLDDLLGQIDGLPVRTTTGIHQVNVDGLSLRILDPSAVERVLGFLANPSLVLALLLVAAMAIFAEFSAPGLGVPGITGVSALALALTGLGQLPVNWLGVVLIIVAVGLALLEVQGPGVGLFGLSAVAVFIFGAFLMFGDVFPREENGIPEAAFGLNPWLVGVLGGMFGALIALFWWAVRSDRRRAATSYVHPMSRCALVGQIAEVTQALDPVGEVLISGEHWKAESLASGHVSVCARVIVREVDELTLKVDTVSERN